MTFGCNVDELLFVENIEPRTTSDWTISVRDSAQVVVMAILVIPHCCVLYWNDFL